jgi:hypothetical protein
MEQFKRKFEVGPKGETEEKELSEEEKKELEEKKKKKYLGIKKDREFIVDEEGNVKIEGTGEDKLVEKDL